MPIRTELKAMARIAAPMVAAQIGLMSLGVVDIMVVGRHSNDALAAASLGNTWVMAILLFMHGILMSADPLVSQAFGAGERESVGRHFQRITVTALVLAIPATLLMLASEIIFETFGQSEEVIPGAASYTRLCSIGNLPFLAFIAIRHTLQAVQRVRPVVIAIVLGNVVNAFFDVALVYGHFGFPRMGSDGCAIVTALVRWAMLIGLVLAARRDLAPYWFGVKRSVHRLREYRKILRMGLPIAVHMSLEIYVFTAITFLMGAQGVVVFNGHTVALVLISATFMAPLGISMAASVRVGAAIGRGDMPAARSAAVAAFLAAIAIQAASTVLFVSMPWTLGRIFTGDAAVLDVVVVLLPIAAAFQLFDGIQCVGCGVLRGAADIRVPALIALLGYWCLGLPFGCYLAWETRVGYAGYWWGLTVGLAVVALLLAARIVVKFRGEIARVESQESG